MRRNRNEYDVHLYETYGLRIPKDLPTVEKANRFSQDARAMGIKLRDAVLLLQNDRPDLDGKFALGRMDVARRRVLSDDGTFAIEWENTGDSSTGECRLVDIPADTVAVETPDVVTITVLPERAVAPLNRAQQEKFRELEALYAVCSVINMDGADAIVEGRSRGQIIILRIREDGHENVVSSIPEEMQDRLGLKQPPYVAPTFPEYPETDWLLSLLQRAEERFHIALRAQVKTRNVAFRSPTFVSINDGEYTVDAVEHDFLNGRGRIPAFHLFREGLRYNPTPNASEIVGLIILDKVAAWMTEQIFQQGDQQ